MRFQAAATAFFLILLGSASLTEVFTDKISYQGRLTDPAGDPVPPGPYDITCMIYEQDIGGSPVWEEVRAVDVGDDGLFFIDLGHLNPLSPDVFSNESDPADSTPRWLEIAVGTDTISPRTLLASVPYAQVASRIIGDIYTTKDTTYLQRQVLVEAGLQVRGKCQVLDSLTSKILNSDEIGCIDLCSIDITADTMRKIEMGTNEKNEKNLEKAPTVRSAYIDLLIADTMSGDTIAMIETSVSADGAVSSYTHNSQELSMNAGSLSFTDALDLSFFIDNLESGHEDSTQAYFSGRVGIGTSTPLGKLHVSDDDSSAAIIGRGTGSGAGLKGINLGTGPALVGMAAAGNLLMLYSTGPVNLRFEVDNSGNLCLDGTITENGGCDVAENMAVVGDLDNYEPGDVLVLSKNRVGFLETTEETYSKRVAGIYSPKPGFHLGANAFGHTSSQVPVALNGIVECKVSSENGPIDIGDMLVTSSTPGYAMKATASDKSFGAVIGKAMEPLSNGRGQMKVLVTLR